jgi:hypothetical protein
MEREHRLTNLSNRFVDSGVKPLKSKEHKMRMVGPGDLKPPSENRGLTIECDN